MSQLSQQSMLQKVRTWSEEQCKDDYESVMPQILHEIRAASSSETMELCSLVLKKFLCNAMIDELGQKIFNTVSLELGRVFYETLENLPGSHQDTKAPTLSNIIEVLKYLVEVLKCYDGFIHRLVSLVKSAVHIELLYISEFSSNTIDILRKSYLHCKNSEKDYGQLFRHVSGLLGIIFQKTFGMQKKFGFIIAHIKQTPEHIISDEIKTSVEKLCQGLLSVCETTCTVDNTLLASTWTTMVKFMKEFKDIVQEKVYPNPYVVLLCDNIVQCVRYSIQLHDQSHHLLNSGDDATNKALNQSLKFSKVLMSIFYEVMKIFDTVFNQELAGLFLSFSHDFHELFKVKDSTNCSECVKMKFRCKITGQLRHYESVIALVLSNTGTHFLDYFCTFSYDSQKIPDYGWLHVWLSIGKELLETKSAMAQWSMKIANCKVASILLVQMIVECVGSTHNVSQSHFNEGSSLYESNLVIVCALLSELPPDAFSTAEETIFDLVFSSTPMKSIFAADVLAFLAKSSPSLAKRYKLVICTIMGTMDNVKKVTFPMQMLISISNRIGVSPKDIVRHLSSHSNALPDWLTLTESSDFDHTCEKVSSGILNVSEQAEISVRNMHDLSDCMSQLELALNNPSIVKKEMRLLKSTFSSAITTIVYFEKCNKELVNSVIFKGFLSHFLASVKNFMPFLDNAQKTQMLKYLQTLLMDGVALPIKLSIIDMLSQCENVPSENLQTTSAIFQRLFIDENWMIRHLSLTTFITLTLSPSQTALLERCASNAAISEIIEAYLAFDSETSGLYRAPLPKPDNVYDLQLEKCLSSWRDRHCKQSESLFQQRNACLHSDCFRQCVSQIRVDIKKLNQVISQSSISRGNIGAEDLQNLASIKSALDELFHQFDL